MGVALYSFHRHPFRTALSMADSADVKYVEGFSFYKLGPAFNNIEMGDLDKAGARTMKEMLTRKRLKMTSMYIGGAKDLQGWKRYFELASELKLEYIVCEPEKFHWDLLDSLAGIYGIKVAIHEHARGLSNYWHPDSVLAAIKGRKNIAACADLGHWVRSGLDPMMCLKKLEGHIAGLHLKDVSESGNIKARDVTPGEGAIDFRAVAKELQRQKFSGYIQVECEHNMDNNVADVKDAIRYFNMASAQ